MRFRNGHGHRLCRGECVSFTIFLSQKRFFVKDH
jgi:hypothetical protein